MIQNRPLHALLVLMSWALRASAEATLLVHEAFQGPGLSPLLAWRLPPKVWTIGGKNGEVSQRRLRSDPIYPYTWMRLEHRN
jgi:hypothetical protein